VEAGGKVTTAEKTGIVAPADAFFGKSYRKRFIAELFSREETCQHLNNAKTCDVGNPNQTDFTCAPTGRKR
jgi:hypothetical protein